MSAPARDPGRAGIARGAGIALMIVLVCPATLVSPVAAAFEWDHPSPESWIAGDSPYRWPIAEASARWEVDLAAGRPWSWPDVTASAVRAVAGRTAWAAGVSLAQLGTDAYRETRLAGGFERRLGAQRLAMVASLLEARAESESAIRVIGSELDLAWSSDLGRIGLRVAATGIAQTSSAAAVGAPRRLGIALRSQGPGAQIAARFEEGNRGRQLVLGLRVPAGPLVLGAGWSTGEPTVRCLAGIRRGSLALTAGLAWHTELPPSQVIAVALAARASEP